MPTQLTLEAASERAGGRGGVQGGGDGSISFDRCWPRFDSQQPASSRVRQGGKTLIAKTIEALLEDIPITRRRSIFWSVELYATWVKQTIHPLSGGGFNVRRYVSLLFRDPVGGVFVSFLQGSMSSVCSSAKRLQPDHRCRFGFLERGKDNKGSGHIKAFRAESSD